MDSRGGALWCAAHGNPRTGRPPHCKEPLTGVVRTRIQEILRKACLWPCPHCRGILGVSHRKGSWMD